MHYKTYAASEKLVLAGSGVRGLSALGLHDSGPDVSV